jgi:hypothetical protein
VLPSQRTGDLNRKRPQSPGIRTPQITFQRRVHHFRGHEFLATYLDANMKDKDVKKSCQRCRKDLGFQGRQCYQCRRKFNLTIKFP